MKIGVAAGIIMAVVIAIARFMSWQQARAMGEYQRDDYEP